MSWHYGCRFQNNEAGRQTGGITAKYICVPVYLETDTNIGWKVEDDAQKACGDILTKYVKNDSVDPFLFGTLITISFDFKIIQIKL